MLKSKLTITERFNKFVKKEEKNECWEWIGGGTGGKRNYGLFGINGKTIGAHRIAYQLAHPEEDIHSKVIMHSCDNPPCCNPAHLISGTHQDNMQDMINKQRDRNYKN